MIDMLTAEQDATTLAVLWDDGTESRIPAEVLRANARDAWTIRERLDHGSVAISPGLRITALQPVGNHAVNVQFSDGHDRAIFPFPYLRELSPDRDN